MRVRTFTADDVTAALAATRRAMGDEALVLGSRRLGDGRVEMTAAAPRTAAISASHPALPPAVLPVSLLGLCLPAATLDDLRRQAAALPAAVGTLEKRALLALEHRLLPMPVATVGRRVVALVGPAGVGKTTTWAKLAARDALLDGRSVGLVSTDTVRIGGLEQARTYASALGLELHAATDTATCQAARAATAGCEVVYVDTPGLAPSHGTGMNSLARMLEEIGADEVHLLLPATGEIGGLNAARQRFGPLRPGCLGFTRVDESVAGGGMVAAALAAGLPVSYLATGPAVPDDLEMVNPRTFLQHGLRAGSLEMNS